MPTTRGVSTQPLGVHGTARVNLQDVVPEEINQTLPHRHRRSPWLRGAWSSHSTHEKAWAAQGLQRLTSGTGLGFGETQAELCTQRR